MQAQQQNYFPDSDTFVELYENIATESQKGQEHFNSGFRGVPAEKPDF